MIFRSDNASVIAPPAMQAVSDAAATIHAGYSADDLTRTLEDRLAHLFECELRVYPVTTGTAANALALATLVDPWGSVLAHQDAHILADECGAVEAMSGARLIALAGADGKMSPEAIRQHAAAGKGDVHNVQAQAISITQANEWGAVYTLAEIEALCTAARLHGLKVHMDGARFANALAATGATAAELTWRAGVDALSLGFTKNGALCAEFVVLFDLERAGEMAFRQKRSGQLMSRGWFPAAQVLALLDGDLWLQYAGHANGMADRLRQGMLRLEQIDVLGGAGPRANMVFARLPQSKITSLFDAGFQFYTGRWDPGVIRLVTSFATRPEDVELLLNHLAE